MGDARKFNALSGARSGMAGIEWGRQAMTTMQKPDGDQVIRGKRALDATDIAIIRELHKDVACRIANWDRRWAFRWIPHYNTGRPHMALGPGVPDPPLTSADHPHPHSRHRRRESYAVCADPILGGLPHEYFLAPAGAWRNCCGLQALAAQGIGANP
jgi:hypothetical protein